jgi:hypothetical protein
MLRLLPLARSTPLIIMSRLLVSSVGLVSALTLGLGACSDPNQAATIAPVIADTLTVFALTGTSPSFPAAYLASSGAVTRADGNFNFDIAFDIDASRNIVIYPQKLVGVPCIVGALNCGGSAGAKPVGLQRFTGSFDALVRAPGDSYVFDSSFVVTPGQGLVMQVQSSSECAALSFSSILYTKLVVDSMDVTRRAIYFRAVHDPNCGYRNLVAGAVPKN